MKKALTLLLTMLMLLSLAACGKEKSTDRSNDNPQSNNSANSDSGNNEHSSVFDPGQYCQAYWGGGLERQRKNDEWAYWIIEADDGKKTQVTIYNYLGTDKSIVIPDTIDGYPVTALANGYPQFAKNMNTEDITNIVFPDSLFKIMGGMLDDTAWYKNQPDGPVYAGKVLYKYKGAIPDGTSFSVADGTLSIADDAFYCARGLTSLTMPDTVVYIGITAFYYCPNLEQISLSKNLRYIDCEVFSNCDALTGIHIPEKLYLLHDGAFDGSGITKIYFEGGETAWNDLCDRSDLTDAPETVFNQAMPD